MSNDDYNKLSLLYADTYYKNFSEEDLNIVQSEGLDYLINIVKKVQTLGMKIKLFEGQDSVFLEQVDVLPAIVDNLSTIVDYGHFRYKDTDQLQILRFSDQIEIDLYQFFNGNISTTKLVREFDDGEKDEVEIYETENNYQTEFDFLIQCYKKSSQVQVFNLSDNYYSDKLDKDGNWVGEVFYINIPYPQMNLKSQGLIPLIKKFVREDLKNINSSFKSRNINSINVVPTAQNSLAVFINVTNKYYEEIVQIEDDKERTKQLKQFRDPIDDELDGVQHRLNDVLSNYCDLEIVIFLNLRTKMQQFYVISQKRLDDIVHQIGTLKNLTNKQHYNSNDELWQHIQRSLLDAVYDLDKSVRFQNQDENKLLFDDYQIKEILELKKSVKTMKVNLINSLKKQLKKLRIVRLSLRNIC